MGAITILQNGNNRTEEECILYLIDKVTALEAENESSLFARECIFVLISAFNIFLMQVGFAMLEVGTVQTKNAKSVLFKNIIDCCAGVMIWWLWGYGISKGIYRDLWTNHDHSSAALQDAHALYFFHSFTFSTTCATIMSGGVVERMTFPAYMSISAAMVGFIYPVTVSWIWTEEGWLNRLGFIDFAGSSAVHALGGVATLAACGVLGARIGKYRYDEEDAQWHVKKFTPHSPVFANLGTFILMFGWLSFNASSTLGAKEADFKTAIRAVVNTMLSGATSCVVGSAYFRMQSGVHNLDKMHNSLLVGLVSITGCCAYVDFYVGPVVGFIAAISYNAGSNLMTKLRIDDPLDAAAVHGCGGVWGTLATGLFVNPFHSNKANLMKGLFFGGGKLLLIQILGTVVILIWGGSVITMLLLLLKKLAAWFKNFPDIRASKDAEILGLDCAYYDGFLFPDLDKSAIIAHNELIAAKRRVRAKTKASSKGSNFGHDPGSLSTRRFQTTPKCTASSNRASSEYSDKESKTTQQNSQGWIALDVSTKSETIPFSKESSKFIKIAACDEKEEEKESIEIVECPAKKRKTYVGTDKEENIVAHL
mmetsp:Transcript_10454/g.13560  ORF Transcript_10454/g.13560 Transcript_10454/m.13560 type:complete len:593 (+) Transcript_10454:268-2046(+)